MAIASLPRVNAGIYADMLHRAAATLGGVSRLALRLEAPPEDVRKWIAGAEEPPLAAFLEALDVVAQGPYARGFRRLRVAAIRTG